MKHFLTSMVSKLPLLGLGLSIMLPHLKADDEYVRQRSDELFNTATELVVQNKKEEAFLLFMDGCHLEGDQVAFAACFSAAELREELDDHLSPIAWDLYEQALILIDNRCDFFDLCLYQALIYSRLDKEIETVETFIKTLDFVTNDKELRLLAYFMGKHLQKFNDDDLAVDAFKLSCDLKDADACIELAMMLAKKNPKQAITFLVRADLLGYKDWEDLIKSEDAKDLLQLVDTYEF